MIMTSNGWIKLPGVFYRWEFDEVIQPAKIGQHGDDFYCEEWGFDQTGEKLYAVFHRAHAAKEMN